MSEATNSTPAPESSAPAAESTNTENTEVLETAESTDGSENIEDAEKTEENSDEQPESIEAASEKSSKEEKKKEAAKKANKKKYKIKVDQKEEDLELDLDNEEEVKKHLQLSRAAQKRMAEYSELKKEVSELIQRLTSDPLGVLADSEGGLGMNVDDLVKGYVEKRLADMEKSPEQRAKEAMEAELKSLKDEKDKLAAEREKERKETALQNEIIKYDNLMTQALEKSEFKKPTPYIVKKMSDYLLLGVENNIDITPDDVLPLVREDIKSEIREFINSAPEDVIEEMFKKELFDRMRKKHVAKAKASPAPTHASSIKDAGGKSAQPKEVAKIDYKKYFGF